MDGRSCVVQTIVLLLVVTTLINVVESGRFRRRAGVWTTTSVSCKADSDYFIDPVCRLKALSRNATFLSVGATLVTRLDMFWIRVKQSQKMNSNRYMPGMFNVKSSVCDLTASLIDNQANPLKLVLLSISPGIFDEYKDMIHKCPYTPAKFYVNETIYHAMDAPLLQYIPASDFKIDYIFTNNADKVLYHLTIFATTK